MVQPERTASHSIESLLPHIPWLAAVSLIAFWRGGVPANAQIVFATLVSLSLLLASPKLRIYPNSALARLSVAALLSASVLCIVPLPSALINVVSPSTAKLLGQFAPTHSPALLSLSPASSILRLWQLAALVALCLLAREAAAAPTFLSTFSFALAVAIIGMAALELWFLWDGKGTWTEVKNYPGGTFANRSHFANWMAVGSTFLLGPLARTLSSCRRNGFARRDAFGAAVLGGAIFLGVGTTLASGSRGGALALAAGTVAWAAILMRKKQRGGALALLALVIGAGVVAFAFSGELLMNRFSEDGTSFKMRIWRDALTMWERFPVFGVGLGSFETAFTHFKTFHGEGTFLFAENEYLEWLVEAGAFGAGAALLALAAMVRMLRRPNAHHLPKSEIFFGAIAALGAFAVHACFEFVLHVTATAALAAALLGIVLGLKQRALGPAVAAPATQRDVVTTLLLTAVIAAFAGQQALAGIRWETGLAEPRFAPAEKKLRSSVDLYPLERQRTLSYTRRVMMAGAAHELFQEEATARARQTLNETLRWRPLDWELRLERAWLILSSSPDSNTALAEAKAVCALNPLQAEIPLRFAKALAQSKPLAAAEFLARTPLQSIEQVREALRIAWLIDPSPSALWNVTPADQFGLSALSDFADKEGLHELAAEAQARLATVSNKETNGAGNRH